MDLLRPTALISLGDLGAGMTAESAARGMGLHIHTFRADPSLGFGGGKLRNTRAVREGKPNQGLVFGRLLRKTTNEEHGAAVSAPLPDWQKTIAGDLVNAMLCAELPVRWIAAWGAGAVDLQTMPGPP